MGNTWKHQWKYRYKRYWREDHHIVVREEKLFEPENNLDLGETMNRLLDNYLVWEYHLPRPRDRAFNPPPYFWEHVLCGACAGRNEKKQYKQLLGRQHRRQWRQVLKQMDFDKMELLPRRPTRYAWEIW